MTTTELNLIQPMDDTRREMYIRARASLVSGDEIFICWALFRELLFTNRDAEVLTDLLEKNTLLEEFFPEFFALYDGKFWPLDLSEEHPATVRTHPHDTWFDYLDRPRRLRLLDFLITHR